MPQIPIAGASKGCDNRIQSGVVGLVRAAARSYLSHLVNRLAWDCLIKLIEGSEGIPPTLPYGRSTFLRPGREANGRGRNK